MFSRRKRLNRAAFPAALASRKRRSTPNFLVIFPDQGSGYAVVVPKKAARLSVTRHRLKRRVLSALASFPALPPALVVLARPGAAQMGYDEIQTELAALIASHRS